jgi:hypothetical protein
VLSHCTVSLIELQSYRVTDKAISQNVRLLGCVCITSLKAKAVLVTPCEECLLRAAHKPYAEFHRVGRRTVTSEHVCGVRGRHCFGKFACGIWMHLTFRLEAHVLLGCSLYLPKSRTTCRLTSAS